MISIIMKNEKVSGSAAVTEVVSKEEADADSLYIDPAEEARVVRKIDFNVLSIVGLLYFLAALDRSNIGNSAAAGLKKEIGLSSAQLSNSVSLMYVTYILSEWPATLLFKKLRPHRFLAVCGFCWGIVTVCMMFVKSYGSLLALRLLLGLFEGGYFPCLAVMVSMFYKPQEQGLRMAIVLSFAALAGAFGGLISYALVQVKSDNYYLQGYRLIYLVEGLITLLAAPLVFFFVPDSPQQCRFLNEKEKQIMAIRTKQREQYMGNDKFEWKEIKKAVSDPRIVLSPIIQFCSDVILYGFLTFLPTILKSGLGFNNNQAQYLTIPVYVTSLIAILVLSIMSDRLQLRSPFLLGVSCVGIIGYILLLAVSNNAVKYFATYLVAFPLYLNAGLNIAWTTGNSMPHYRRTALMGTNQTIGNIAGVVAGQVYRTLPYKLGHGFSLGCLVVLCIATMLNVTFLRHQNRVKQQIINGDREDTKLERTGDHALDFKYKY